MLRAGGPVLRLPSLLETRDAPILFPPLLPSLSEVPDIPPLLPRRTLPRPPEPIPVPAEGVSLHSIIEYIERKHSSSDVDLNSLVSHFCVRRKTLYDMMSIMIALGIATRISPTSYHWHGIDHIDNAISFVQQQSNSNLDDQPLETMFKCAKDASLGNLSLSLLKLFWFIGSDNLNLHSVASLFGQRDVRFSSILRRLVVIRSCLRVVGVAHSDSSSESITLIHPKLLDLVTKNKSHPATSRRLHEYLQLVSPR